MTALLIEKGDPKPWVEAGWGPNAQAATFYVVSCGHCGKAEWNYTPGVVADPGWPKRMVDLHNQCTTRPGALDPWQPGTP